MHDVCLKLSTVLVVVENRFLLLLLAFLCYLVYMSLCVRKTRFNLNLNGFRNQNKKASNIDPKREYKESCQKCTELLQKQHKSSYEWIRKWLSSSRQSLATEKSIFIIKKKHKFSKLKKSQGYFHVSLKNIWNYKFEFKKAQTIQV